MILKVEIDCSMILINPIRHTKGVLILTTDIFINFQTLGSFVWKGCFCGQEVVVYQKDIHTDPTEVDIELPEVLTLNKRLLAAKIKEVVKRQTS